MALWTPAQLGSTVRAWYQMDLLTGSNGSTISTVTDSSSNGFNLTGVNTPTLVAADQNGLNTAQMVGAGADYFTMSVNVVSGLAAGSVYIVYKGTATATNYTVMNIGSSGNDSHYPYLDNNFYNDFGSTTRKSVGAATNSVTSYRILSIYSAPSDWAFYVDGGTGGSSGGTSPLYSTTANSVGWIAGPNVIIGNNAGTNNFNPHRIAEIVFTNAKQSTAERQAMEGYLAWKWGLQGNLSSSHPYKSAAPTVSMLDGLSGVSGAWSAARKLLTAYSANSGAFYQNISGEADIWYDQSGNTRNFGAQTSATRPTPTASGPNSRTALNFATPADRMDASALSNFISASDGYFIATFNTARTSTNATNIYDNDPVFCDGGGYTGIHIKNGSIYGFNYSGTVTTPTAEAISTGTTYVVEWWHTGGNLNFRLNGGTTQTVASGNTGAVTGLLRIGANYNGTVFFSGNLFELVAFSTVPASGTRDALVADMTAYYVTFTGPQTLTPSLVTDTDTFYVPSIIGGALSPAGGQKYWFNGLSFTTATPPSGTTLGGQKYWFNGLPMAAWSAAPSTGNTLTANLVTDADTFYAPTITTGAVTLAPSLYTDPDTFHAPSLGIITILAPSLYIDADAFYVPTISQTFPVQTLTPSLYVDADVFRVPNVGIDNRFIDVDVFYPFKTTAIVVPIWYRESDSIHPPSLASRTTILPPWINDASTDAVYPPIVGVRTLSPPFINADVTIYSPTASRYTPVLPPLVTAPDVFFTPNILRGSLTLRPNRIIDPDIFLSPIVGIVLVSDNPPGGDPANLPGNLKYVSRYAITQSGLILSMDLQSSSTKIVNTRMVVYRETAGLPVALAGVTVDKTSVVTGINNYRLIAPVSVLAGDNIWMGLHSDGNFNWFLSNAPGGSKFNTDTWVGGATDPFGPASNDNKKAPIVVYYLQSSNASITVDKVIDLDVIYPPALSQISILRPSLVIEEFFYTPIVGSNWAVAPSFHDDINTFYAPTLSETIRPALVASDDQIYSPFLAKFAPTVFSAPMPSDDVVYQTTVTLPDLRLAPQRVVDTDVFYSPTRSSSKELLPPVVSALDVIFTPVTVSKGAVTLLPPFESSELDFYLPEITVIGGAKVIAPRVVTDLDVFYPPKRKINDGWRRQVYITGLESDEVDIIGLVPTPELVE